jgi:hypothetical protein
MATSTGLAMSWDEWHKHDALALAGRDRLLRWVCQVRRWRGAARAIDGAWKICHNRMRACRLKRISVESSRHRICERPAISSQARGVGPCWGSRPAGLTALGRPVERRAEGVTSTYGQIFAVDSLQMLR